MGFSFCIIALVLAATYLWDPATNRPNLFTGIAFFTSGFCLMFAKTLESDSLLID